MNDLTLKPPLLVMASDLNNLFENSEEKYINCFNKVNFENNLEILIYGIKREERPPPPSPPSTKLLI